MLFLYTLTGWMRCDGSTIPQPSIWHGLLSPNLNSDGLFLRGGSDTEVLNKQDDQMQDHLHVDSGHTHENVGHRHDYGEYYSRFSGEGTGECLPEAKQCVDYLHGESHLNCEIWAERTSELSNVEIQSSMSNMGGVHDAFRSGEETRPKNMKVVYIIKIY